MLEEDDADLAKGPGAGGEQKEGEEGGYPKHKAELAAEATQGLQAGLAPPQHVPVEEAVSDLLLREEEEEALPSPHQKG